MLVLVAACGPMNGEPRVVDHEPSWIFDPAPPGPDPSLVVEVFPQIAAPTTDVLVVFDPILELGVVALLPLLADHLDELGTDWRIAPVSTALGGEVHLAAQGGWIAADDPLPDELIPSPDGPHHALGVPTLAFTDPRLGLAFADSAVQVLFVLAEDDTYGDPEHFARSFAELRPLARERSVAVLAPASAAVVRGLPSGDEPVGTLTDVEEVVSEAALVATGLTRSFPLSYRPAPDSLELTIEDVSGATLDFDLGVDFSLDEAQNTAHLDRYWPNPGAVVVVRYRVEGPPSED